MTLSFDFDYYEGVIPKNIKDIRQVSESYDAKNEFVAVVLTVTSKDAPEVIVSNTKRELANKLQGKETELICIGIKKIAEYPLASFFIGATYRITAIFYCKGFPVWQIVALITSIAFLIISAVLAYYAFKGELPQVLQPLGSIAQGIGLIVIAITIFLILREVKEVVRR